MSYISTQILSFSSRSIKDFLCNQGCEQERRARFKGSLESLASDDAEVLDMMRLDE